MTAKKSSRKNKFQKRKQSLYSSKKLWAPVLILLLVIFVYVSVYPVGRFTILEQSHTNKQSDNEQKQFFFNKLFAKEPDLNADACIASTQCKTCYNALFLENPKSSDYSPLCCGDDKKEFYKNIALGNGKYIAACCNNPEDILKPDGNGFSCQSATDNIEDKINTQENRKEDKSTEAKTQLTVKTFTDLKGNVFSVPAGTTNEITLFDDGKMKRAFIDKEGNFLSDSDENMQLFSSDSNGYIIEFEEQPVFKKKTELVAAKQQNIERKVQQYRQAVLSVHDDFKNKLADINSGIKISREFTNIFNGIVIDAEKSDIERIKSLPHVKKVYPNREVKAFLNESVPLINADDVWNEGYTGEGVTIAIIDTGVDYTHPDLGGCFGEGCKVIGGYDVVNQDSDPMDDQGHGTHVAATAAGSGVLNGVAPGASILAYKVLNSGGSGTWAQVIEGIERSIDPNNDDDYSDHADIISMSLGGWGNPDDPVSTAVDNAVDVGAVATIAAGNSGDYETIGSPGTARKAITVGATDKNDVIASFSSRGPVIWGNNILIKPEVTAPGVSICAAQWDDAWSQYECYDDRHTAISGTSMATPHVAGAAALLLDAHPEWSPQDVKSALMLSAQDLGYDIFTQGAGRIDVFAAHNTPFLTDPQSININMMGTSVYIQPVTIKNLESFDITLELDAGTVEDYLTHQNYTIVTIDSSITIPAHSERAVLLTVNLSSDIYGIFYGKVRIIYNNKEHVIPYVVSRLVMFGVVVTAPDREMAPSIIGVHNRDFSIMKSVGSGWDFEGNIYTFGVIPGNYTAYARGDDINWSLNYFLMKEFEVKKENQYTEGVLDLSEARPFTVKAELPDGRKLNLFKWFVEVYSGFEKPFQVGYGYIGFGFYGDRILYLSNKPSSAFDTDIIVQYYGTPDTTGYNIDEWWATGKTWDPEWLKFKAISNSYKVATEQYSMGWVLHNINDSTPTTLDYTVDELSDYPHSFNYPGNAAVSYYNIYFWLPVVPKYGYGFDMTLWEYFYPPLERNYYFYWTNPAPERYGMMNTYPPLGANFTFQNYMVVNYLKGQDYIEQFAYDVGMEEYNNRYRGWYEIVPVPEDNEHVYFGTAPLVPTSVFIDSDVVHIGDHMMELYGNKSFLQRDTYIRVRSGGTIYEYPLEPPVYSIYLNGILVQEGNITDGYGNWFEDMFYYSFYQDGEYVVNITIPSFYPTWNITKISAEITKPSADMQPPVLMNATIAPVYKINEQLPVTLTITDNIAVQQVQLFYNDGADWHEVSIGGAYPVYTGYITITDPSVDAIDLKIIAQDTTGNSISYEVYPASLKARNIYLDFSGLGPFIKGRLYSLHGTCTDDHGTDCSHLKVKFYRDDVLLGYGPVMYNASSEYGEVYYGFFWDVPYDDQDVAHLRAVFDELTGAYVYPAQAAFDIELITPEAYFTDQYSEMLEDTDNDGYYNYLDIDVGVNVTKSGYYRISGNLYTEGGGCGGGQCDPQVYLGYAENYIYLDEGSHFVRLQFNGWNMQREERNGPYVLQALWLYNDTYYEWDHINDAYRTATYSYTIFDPLPARLADVYQDYATDEDNDNLYDKLVVEAGVNVAEIRDYTISAGLYAPSGANIDTISVPFLPEGTGLVFVPLEFDGIDIRASGEDGPYVLRYVFLQDTQTWTELDYEENPYNTSYYSYTEFEQPKAQFNDVYSDYGTDTDNDGFYNYLTVEAGVNVAEEGDFQISANLYTQSDLFIGSAYSNVHLTPGTYNIQLNFSGLAIRASEEDGPYNLRYLSLYDTETWTQLDYEYSPYTTSYYSYTEFEQMLDAAISVGYDWQVEFGNDIMLEAFVENIGTGSIPVHTVTLYKVEEQDIFLDQWCIGGGDCSYNLGTGESVSHNFSFTPNEPGYYTFKLVLNASNDEIEYNNYIYAYVNVLIFGPDVSVYMNAPAQAALNVQTPIGISASNYGTGPAYNITLRLYDNNEEIYSEFIDFLGQYSHFYTEFNWTPLTQGYHTLRLEASVAEDINYENNVYETIVYVYIPVDVVFDFRDVYGSFYPTFLYIENVYEGIVEQPLNIQIPDTSLILLAHIQDYNGFAVFYNNSAAIPQMSSLTYYAEPNSSDNNIHVYAVYANSLSWVYTDTRIIFSYNNISQLGINDTSGLQMFACAEWDFDNNRCVSEWVSVNAIIGVYQDPYGATGIYGEGYYGIAEAFALGKQAAQGCGNVITQNYTMGSDLLCDEGGGFVIGADGITLDCNNHLIKNINPENYHYTINGVLLDNVNYVTIKNCRIEGFYNAVLLDNANNNNLINISGYLSPEGYGALFLSSSNNYLYNNIFYSNEFGLEFAYGSNNNNAELIHADYNTVGVAFYSNSMHNTARFLNTNHNSLAGIYIIENSNFTEVRDSTSHDNAQYDILIRDSYNISLINVSYDTIFDNTGPCTLTHAYIVPDCGTNFCEQGEKIEMYGELAGNCEGIDHFQIDAHNDSCSIEYFGGDIRGIDAEGDQLIVTENQVIGSWTIPAVPAKCRGKVEHAVWAAIRQGGPPEQGIIISETGNVSGEFRFRSLPGGKSLPYEQYGQTGI